MAMALPSYIFPISVTSSTIRFRPNSSKWVLLLENSRRYGFLRATPTHRRDQIFGGGVLVRNSVLPDGTPPIPSGSPSSWKKWILGLVITLVFPMWRSKLGPLSLLKYKLDTVVQTAEDIAEVVEQVAEQVDKLAEEVSEHLPQGGKLRRTMEVIEDLAEETAKQAHLLGDVIDKVQEMEDDLEELIEHPVIALAAKKHVQKDIATATSLEEVVELEDRNDSSQGNANESLSS